MATEEPLVQPPVSTAKFNPLITEALAEGPKKVKELYQIALDRQPQDCPNIACSHRKKVSKSMEWQHEIQRQLARVATNRDGLWHLKSAAIETTVPTVPANAPALPTPVAEMQAEPVVRPPYTGDPFIVTADGHFMDVEEFKKPEGERFVVPRNFDEFYAKNPKYVLNWVKKRLNKFTIDDDVEDWTQDLIIHLKYLPQGSKHRIPGANGRVQGCQDVIETFDPIQQYGASERRFRYYLNFCLGNKFNTVQSKRQKNPVCRPGNVAFGAGFGASHGDDDMGHTGDEFVHANSDYLASATMRQQKQQDDRMFTNEFKRFVEGADPSVIQAVEALEATGTIGEAARLMGVSDGEFTRFRNRLKQLGECFLQGTPVPKQRRPYKKRAPTPAVVAETQLETLISQ